MKYLVMCIGNRDGGDDVVGLYIANKLKGLKNDDFGVIDCGTVPENYTSAVKNYKPKNLIIIDAVKMGLSPGEIRFVPKEKIGSMHVSTHGIPLSVLMKYLEDYVENILLIGIQPKTMTGKMTAVVKKSGNKLVKIIKSKNLEEIKKLR